MTAGVGLRFSLIGFHWASGPSLASDLATSIWPRWRNPTPGCDDSVPTRKPTKTREFWQILSWNLSFSRLHWCLDLGLPCSIEIFWWMFFSYVISTGRMNNYVRSFDRLPKQQHTAFCTSPDALFKSHFVNMPGLASMIWWLKCRYNLQRIQTFRIQITGDLDCFLSLQRLKPAIPPTLAFCPWWLPCHTAQSIPPRNMNSRQTCPWSKQNVADQQAIHRFMI